jgi:hypothetical protein
VKYAPQERTVTLNFPALGYPARNYPRGDF